VVRGHDHSIQLRLTCQAESGLVGLDVGCIFYNDVFGINLGGDPHAKWTELSITVEQDIFERLDQIDMKLDQMDGKLDQLDVKLNQMDMKLDQMDGKLDEAIELLITPQGRRPGFPATSTQGNTGTSSATTTSAPPRVNTIRSPRRGFFR
jgi:hypothetical protein